MQSTNLPSKYLVPFATNDSAKVEIPVTTATVGRASQSLGFPPITGQPPETGGLPPQLEDFNGAVNQIARVAWWSMLGGQWRYDATFATDANINGYPAGAELQSVADNRITWLSLVDNNTADPDGVGTGWVPLTSYAPATIGTAGGTTTPTLPIAAHETLLVSGTLSSNAVLILPVWTRGWTITNSTTGAFTVTVKTAAGSGVVLPQNGAPTRVTGDGTNITQPSSNIANASTSTQAMALGQAIGRLLNVQTFTGNGTYTPTAGTTRVVVEVQAGGGAGGGSAVTTAAQVSAGNGGGAGAYAKALLTAAFSGVTVTVGAAGAAAAAANGTAGGTSSFGTIISCPGGGGGLFNGAGTASGVGGGSAPSGAPTVTAGQIFIARGEGGFQGAATSVSNSIGGKGGGSLFGCGGYSTVGTGTGILGANYGTGGSGAAVGGGSATTFAGGGGGGGIVIVWEYA